MYLVAICVFFGEMSTYVFCFFLIGFIFVELYVLFVYFRNEALVDRIVCKYFLPFHRLCFHFVYGFLGCAKSM